MLSSRNNVGTPVKVAKEEDAHAKAEHLGCEAEFLVHGERGKPRIDAVKIGDEKAKDKKWDEAPGDLARYLLSQAIHWSIIPQVKGSAKRAIRRRDVTRFIPPLQTAHGES
jgi:hypothetical protein